MSRSRPASNPVSYHKHTKQYYVTRGGKRIYLGSDKKEALKKYHRLGLGIELVQQEPVPPVEITIKELAIVTNPRTKRKYAIPHSIDINSYTINDLVPQKQANKDCYTVKELWDMIVRDAHATGEPGVCLIERINEANPTPHLGQIEACIDHLQRIRCINHSKTIGRFSDCPIRSLYHQLRRCTAKTTIYCANIAAGFMVAQFTKYLRLLPVDLDIQVNLLASEINVGDVN